MKPIGKKVSIHVLSEKTGYSAQTLYRIVCIGQIKFEGTKKNLIFLCFEFVLFLRNQIVDWLFQLSYQIFIEKNSVIK